MVFFVIKTKQSVHTGCLNMLYYCVKYWHIYFAANLYANDMLTHRLHSQCESGTGSKCIKSLKVCVSVFASLYHQILAWLLSAILPTVIKTPKDTTIDDLNSPMLLLRACVPVICTPNRPRKMSRRLRQTHSSLRKKKTMPNISVPLQDLP